MLLMTEPLPLACRRDAAFLRGRKPDLQKSAVPWKLQFDTFMYAMSMAEVRTFRV